MPLLSSAAILAFLALAGVGAHGQIGPVRQGDLTLTLECRDSGQIRFELRNVGATDTALQLGSVVGNGRKYTINELYMIQKTPNGQVVQHHYWPRRYPAAIGGSLGEWVQAVPAQTSYSVSAVADDFFNYDFSGRLAAFAAGTELALKLTVPTPRQQTMLLAYWSGTLTSNSCKAP